MLGRAGRAIAAEVRSAGAPGADDDDGAEDEDEVEVDDDDGDADAGDDDADCRPESRPNTPLLTALCAKKALSTGFIGAGAPGAPLESGSGSSVVVLWVSLLRLNSPMESPSVDQTVSSLPSLSQRRHAAFARLAIELLMNRVTSLRAWLISLRGARITTGSPKLIAAIAFL